VAKANIPGPLTEINRLVRENRVSEYSSPNLALGMSPIEFGEGTSRWVWNHQADAALNPFGTLQGGYLAVFIDELFSTAVASVLEAGELAMTASSTWAVLRRP
jgi:acyl-coenzyme A thioesterase PaaI-like protein